MDDLTSTEDCDGGVERPEEVITDFESGVRKKEELLPALYQELRQMAAARNHFVLSEYPRALVDVQLRKHSDLIPNILKIASRFMQHERGTHDANHRPAHASLAGV